MELVRLIGFISTLLFFHCGDGFVLRRLSNSKWPSPHAHAHITTTRSRLQSTSWNTDAVPAGYADAANIMANALVEALTNTSSSQRQLLSVDLLTPGLNPKLEQKALLMQEYLFDLVRSLVPALEQSRRFNQVQLMFQSMGDAAGYQKYSYQVQAPLPDWITLADVDYRRVRPDDDCLVFITSKNNVGDPVITEIQKIVAAYPATTCIFLNCDLSDRVTSGIASRGPRDEFRASIKPAFYFRNVVQMSRPSLVPNELGAMVYTPSTGWMLYGINTDDTYGPGSLNRYMKQGVFMRDKNDPTVLNPPRFAVVGRYDAMPKRDEIDEGSESESVCASFTTSFSVCLSPVNNCQTVSSARPALSKPLCPLLVLSLFQSRTAACSFNPHPPHPTHPTHHPPIPSSSLHHHHPPPYPIGHFVNPSRPFTPLSSNESCRLHCRQGRPRRGEGANSGRQEGARRGRRLVAVRMRTIRFTSSILLILIYRFTCTLNSF
jgi:hypothetical protein